MIIENCCGCAACANSCSNNAIIMKPNKYGFLYPYIYEDRCIDCGLCKKVCESRNAISIHNSPLATYAAINRDQRTLMSSSSGGMFSAIASIVFGKNGVVFGCAFNKEMNAEHVYIESKNELFRLQGSKYVQSSINKSLNEARNFLEEGRTVLFTGTPCQIVGLKAYLGREYSELITVDTICHGVPSTIFFKDYIKYLEGRLKCHILDFQFRDKSKGWESYIGKIIYKKGRTVRVKYIPWFTSYYYSYFIQGDILRDCCYECKYASGQRVADVTLGDYWGIKEIHPEISSSNGVSVVLVNSEKGLAVVKQLSREMVLKQSVFEKARKYNAQLNYPPAKGQRRQKIFETWLEGGYQAVAKAHKDLYKAQIAVLNIKSFVPISIKTLIKRIFGRVK